MSEKALLLLEHCKWRDGYFWVEVPAELKDEAMACIENCTPYTAEAEAIWVRERVQPSLLEDFLKGEMEELVVEMMPWGLGLEAFHAFAETGDWVGWRELARREIQKKVEAEAPYYVWVPDPGADPRVMSSASMAVIQTDEIIPTQKIFDYRWADYEEKLDSQIPKYMAMQRLAEQLRAEECHTE